jgi:hypothetical protein
MTKTSLGASPCVVTRVFSPKSATAEQWQAFHCYIRLRVAEEDPGEPVVTDEVRQRDMQTNGHCSRPTVSSRSSTARFSDHLRCGHAG